MEKKGGADTQDLPTPGEALMGLSLLPQPRRIYTFAQVN